MKPDPSLPEMPPLGDRPLKKPALVSQPVAGFSAGAAAAGIRNDGREDLALIAAEGPVAAAGVFTRSLLPAAPVQVARANLASGRVRAIVANSGCANAATGRPGLTACRRACSAVARALGCPAGQVIPCSTGVIGQLLPDKKIAAALPGLAAGLSPQGLPRAAQAIMTTDAFPKMAQAQLELGGRPVKVVGMAKGAGMIRPDMATMLAFVLSDAAASPAALQRVVGQAARESFNRASVDGDTSTNDTLLLLASGRAGNRELGPRSAGLKDLARAVTRVCQELAAMMVADGEGASHLIRVVVSGAASQAQARALCYAVAHSPLCKTAFYGQDPNWGRILAAAAAESARRRLPFKPERCRLWIGPALLVRGGRQTSARAESQAAAQMKKPRFQVRLDLGLGPGHFWVLTSDLTHEYVDINADYRS